MKGRKTWLCADLPQMEYRKAWDMQRKLVAARERGDLSTDVLLLLEHAPVFTLGRRGKQANFLISADVLQARGIPVVRVERGGDVTYHGPGQLIGYPIINLHVAHLTVADYVELLEEVMIRTAAHWGVHAGRSDLNRGIWVGSKKMGSIGIAIRRGITYHGLAFNVNMSLEPFIWINPCGLRGISMTSLERETVQELSKEEARRQLKSNFQAVFNVELEPTGLDFAALNNQVLSHFKRVTRLRQAQDRPCRTMTNHQSKFTQRSKKICF